MTQLVALDTISPLTVFTDNGLDPIIDKIEKEARSYLLDISTESGRKEIASLSYKIAQSKTALDKMGKELVSGWKEQAKKVDVERARAWDRLEALQKEIRQPLTEWENKEKERIAAHEAALAAIPEHTAYGQNETAAEIASRLDSLLNYPARDWQEFATRASLALAAEIDRMKPLLVAAQKREAEAAELERLRREAEERAVKEREERIAAEAAAKAKAEAEDKARKDAEAAEQARLLIQQEKEAAEARAKKAEEDRQAAVVKAEQDRVASEQKAKRDAELAAQRERERIEAERKAEAQAAAKREADKKHRASVNREALAALTSAGVPEEVGKLVIETIAKRLVPHVAIQY